MRLRYLSSKCRAILEKYMEENDVSYTWDAISQIVEDWGKGTPNLSQIVEDWEKRDA